MSNYIGGPLDGKPDLAVSDSTYRSRNGHAIYNPTPTIGYYAAVYDFSRSHLSNVPGISIRYRTPDFEWVPPVPRKLRTK